MNNRELESLELMYSRLYELSQQIGELIEREIYTELVTFIKKKEQLLAQANILIEKLQGQQLNTDKLSEICKKYKEQEEKNIKALSTVKDNIKCELAKTTKDRKILSAYGYRQEQVSGNILDYREE